MVKTKCSKKNMKGGRRKHGMAATEKRQRRHPGRSRRRGGPSAANIQGNVTAHHLRQEFADEYKRWHNGDAPWHGNRDNGEPLFDANDPKTWSREDWEFQTRFDSPPKIGKVSGSTANARPANARPARRVARQPANARRVISLANATLKHRTNNPFMAPEARKKKANARPANARSANARAANAPNVVPKPKKKAETKAAFIKRISEFSKNQNGFNKLMKLREGFASLNETRGMRIGKNHGLAKEIRKRIKKNKSLQTIYNNSGQWPNVQTQLMFLEKSNFMDEPRNGGGRRKRRKPKRKPKRKTSSKRKAKRPARQYRTVKGQRRMVRKTTTGRKYVLLNKKRVYL